MRVHRRLLAGSWSRLGGHALNFGSGAGGARARSSAGYQSLKTLGAGNLASLFALLFSCLGTADVVLIPPPHPVVPEILGNPPAGEKTHTSGWMLSNPPAERWSRAPEFRGTHGELQSTKVSETVCVSSCLEVVQCLKRFFFFVFFWRCYGNVY